MSFVNKFLKNVYADILNTDNTNSGLGNTLKQIKCGDGDGTALYLSQRQITATPASDTTAAFTATDKDGNALITVDSTNDLVKLGINQVAANTQTKGFGLWDFTPTQGAHHTLISHAQYALQASSAAFAGFGSAFGTGADPATTLDVSTNSAYPRELIASMWYLQNAITIDEIRVLVGCDSSHSINFHLFSYDLDVSTNHGDLSGGTLLAHNGSTLEPTISTVKTDTLTLDSTSVAASKVILAFIENVDGTSQVHANVSVKYHLT